MDAKQRNELAGVIADGVAAKAKRVFELMDSQEGTKAFGSVMGTDILITIERVKTRYVECEFPEPAKAGLIAQGSKPIKAIVWLRSDRVAYGMLSDDPSGDNGEIERHLSVSASTAGIGRRMPTQEEVSEAAKAVGLDVGKCEVSEYRLGVHLFCPC